MRKRLKTILTYSVIYVLTGGLGTVFIAGANFQHPWNFVKNMAFGVVICIILWEGNGLLSDWIDKYIDWVKEPLKRMIVGIAGMLIYTSLAMFVIYYIFVVWIGGKPLMENLGGLKNTMISGIGITAIIALVLYSRGFLINWREAALRAEKLKREQLNSRYMSLKSQLKPHFLFNSLNALSGLVYQDQDQAARFIKQLSQIYRYILQHAEQEVVSLDKELACIDSYLFLMKIRFGENLQSEIEVEHAEKWMIPPLSLQMLAENAIKHNVISSDQPLFIRIYTESPDVLVIENSLQRKESDAPSIGIGLENIRARYQFLSERKIEVEQLEAIYRVKLPLLQFQAST